LAFGAKLVNIFGIPEKLHVDKTFVLSIVPLAQIEVHSLLNLLFSMANVALHIVFFQFNLTHLLFLTNIVTIAIVVKR
jgi:hypothetical protein